MCDKVENKPEKYPQWRINDGLLYKYVKCEIPELSAEEDPWKLIVPKDKRKSLLLENHDDPKSRHLGTYKTFWRLRKRFTWPKMHAAVFRYVKSCTVCAQHNQNSDHLLSKWGRDWRYIDLGKLLAWILWDHSRAVNLDTRIYWFFVIPLANMFYYSLYVLLSLDI